MKFKTKVILYLSFVTVIFALGSWAYQEVAVKNRPLSPDEVAATEKPVETPDIEDKKLNEFKSSDDSVSFSYPTGWKIEESEGTNKDIVQSVTLTNFEQNKALSGGFPENGIRIDLVISQLSDTVRNVPLIGCEMKATFCGIIEINGQKFKKSESMLNTGFIQNVLGTDLKDKRVVFEIIIGTGTNQKENAEIVNTIMQSVKTQK